MEYYFNELDPVKFQRLINTILISRFGENARLTPLRGQDGGRDGETAPGNPYYEYQVDENWENSLNIFQRPDKGRYLFQVKHHRTTEKRLSELRQSVIADFRSELKENVLTRKGDERVNNFFLITNVPTSKNALSKLDTTRRNLLKNTKNLHADIWWQETIISYLDQMPSVWNSFPEIFAGSVVPFIASIVNRTDEGLPRTFRLAINFQYDQDKNVKFRQVELEQSLSRLFVDLELDVSNLSEESKINRLQSEQKRLEQLNISGDFSDDAIISIRNRSDTFRSSQLVSALGVLLDDDNKTAISKLILEGGPGQGKSTLSQMAMQIYREKLLGRSELSSDGRWLPPKKLRLPLRVELRSLADWLNSKPEGSVEEYLAFIIQGFSGGNKVSVGDIHTSVERSPVFLIFDGLDEIGNDSLRNKVLSIIDECINRLENLQTDLRVVITTRPPALVGRRETLIDFERLTLVPMGKDRIEDYVTRWLSVQVRDKEEENRIRQSFEGRQDEPHVEALARNPMQLSVLLQFIELKGDAFPDRRAELYRDYFQIVIDRDVEKSPELRKNRDIIESLHGFIGYKIHALTEVNQADRTLERNRLLEMVRNWLVQQGNEPSMAQQFFKLGEERFGLVVASKGEGEETKYGYEVQPIQEYFAASFISNQIESHSAHDVFEAMIHRPYWKEVALFLAGLRRPNEKADLVIRAKNVDQDKTMGWYLDGRAIVLQLLHEGVFSEPRYVFSLALDFVLDVLDPNKLKIQREPSELLSTLGELVSRTPVEDHKDRISQMIKDFRNSDDRYILMRLFLVASKLFSRAEFKNALRSYNGSDLELTAELRLGWPYNWGINIEDLTQEKWFWEGVPHHTWAKIWFERANFRGEILDLTIPKEIHQHIVEQYAVNSGVDVYVGFYRSPLFSIESNLAIWKLFQYHRALRIIGVSRMDDDTIFDYKDIQKICEEKTDLDYSGLDEPIRTILPNLIRLSRSLLLASSNGGIDNSTALAKYISYLRNNLEYPGLASWLVCKCAIDVIHSMDIDITSPSETSQESILLAEDIQPFYEGGQPYTSDDQKHNSKFLNFLLFQRSRRSYIYRSNRLNFLSPKFIRLENKSELVSIEDIIASCVRSGRSLPFTWIMNSRINIGLRPLIEQCKDCLPELLEFLGKCEFGNVGMGGSLRVQDTQRILKIARNTEDPAILSGVSVALMVAKFLRLAEVDLIAKILQAKPSARFSRTLFDIYDFSIEDRNPSLFSKELLTIEQLAKRIFSSPEDYSFYDICRATNFLAERNPTDYPPLLSEESNFGISPE